MEIRLVDDWDLPISPPGYGDRTVGHFVGRDFELQMLANDFLRRSQGSIFVGGYRGVGKTSLIYAALGGVNEQKGDQDYVFVLLNAAQLEAEGGASTRISPKSIILNIIRRLYTSTNASDLNRTREFGKVLRNIADLYRKAVAEEFVASEQYSLGREAQTEEVKISGLQFRLDDITVAGLAWAVTFSFALILQALPIRNSWGSAVATVLNDVLPLLLASPISFAAAMYLRRERTESKSVKMTARADQLYKFDNSMGNLEFDLEGIHRDLAVAGVRVIYVIDELDKLDANSVVEVLKFFKNLFTLSSALFVFVGGEELFARLEKRQPGEDDLYRAKTYTYFSSKYFVSRPSDTDLFKFLIEISENSDLTSEQRKLRKDLHRALIFDAKGDFFDLVQMVRDRISKFDGPTPVIELDRLSDDDRLRASFQKAISAVFAKYHLLSASKWLENEQIARGLYDEAYHIVALTPESEVADNRQDTVVGSARRDLTSLLQRVGGLIHVSEEGIDIGGYPTMVRNYRYTGEIDERVPDSLDRPSELESRYMVQFETLTDKLVYYVNLHNSAAGIDLIYRGDFLSSLDQYAKQLTGWGLNLESQLMKLNSIYSGLRIGSGIYRYNRDQIEGFTNEARSALASARKLAHEVLARSIADAVEADNLHVRELPEDPNLFSGAMIPIRDDLLSTPHRVVMNEDYSKQLFIGDLQSDNPALSKGRLIKDGSSNHRIVVFESPESLVRRRTRGLVAISGDPEKLRSSATKVQDLKEWLAPPAS